MFVVMLKFLLETASQELSIYFTIGQGCIVLSNVMSSPNPSPIGTLNFSESKPSAA